MAARILKSLVFSGSALGLIPLEHAIDATKERAARYIDLFHPTPSQLKKCFRSFLLELQKGLEMHSKSPNTWLPEECSLMMLDCCINFVPTGKEKGVYYAVDFGGTNLRAIRCTLDGQGNASLKTLKHNMRSVASDTELPKGLLDKKATASMLFNDIASAVNLLMQQEGDEHLKNVGVGFTFSFGTKQKSLTSAILTGWTKDFETGIETNDPVIGSDVCALLNKAFERKKLSAKVSAVLNDTVGAMLSGSYSKSLDMPPCMVGVILGTGLNGAYVQPDAKNYGYQGVVMNTELGGFDEDLPITAIDLEIDFNSTARGRQRFEKMCSGMYIPELVRLLVLRVFQEAAPSLAWTPQSLTGKACGAMLNDKAPFLGTSEVVCDLWSWEASSQQIEVLHCLVQSGALSPVSALQAVFQRSAALSTVAIAAMAKATGRLQPAMGGVTVGIDGSLYVLNRSFQDSIRHYLEIVLDKETSNLIHCVIAEDGSGKGAAILAAALACQEDLSF